ncbi:DNA primase [Lacticaseibacillus baoqingensis]|uniref:DNA primase n=1 Tax=Lacticaseibacillus baoqingensis TaxID=2486013 RepID=A0ABW4E8G2_9LACO|nr:DNA primase [Lacticaseibacillus baoqingensis]
MIPEATVDQIRTTVNIADYIGQYVSLQSKGQNLFGVCPFHEEKTPSFSVNESKQIFKCFSCGRGGNVFTFVMDYDHLSFPEAVAKVAEYVHIPVAITPAHAKQPEDPAKTAQKTLLREVTDLCHHVLVNTVSGEPALAYLTKRGLSRETIDHFEIGYAPADNDLIRAFLEKQGVDYATQRASGLFVEDDTGALHARFKDRIMFPLKDAFGAVIGFSGRVLSGSAQAKYLNSPETSLFNKRNVLFNLDAAKSEFKSYGAAILFEGFMDVIAAYQAGIPVGIASMGTSLTQEQVQIIAHQTRQLIICYDGDAPGQKATARALALVENHPRLETNVVVLPDQQDPDEYIKARGAAAFQAQLHQVLTPLAFQLQFMASGKDMTNDRDRLAYIDAALPQIARVSEPAAQTIYLQQVSAVTNVAVEDLRLSLPQAAPMPQAPPPPEEAPYPEDYGASPAVAVSAAPHYDKFERAERELLYYAWQEPLIARQLHTQDFKFAHPAYQQLFDAWIAYAATTQQPDFAAYLDQIPPELMTTATDVSMQSQLPEPESELIDDLIALIATNQTFSQLQQVKQALRQAQQLGDKAGVTKLSIQYVNLMRAYKTNSNV